MRLVKNLGFMAAGAIATYLLDPDRGRGRRAELSARARARAADVATGLNARARYEAGRVKGALHETFVPEVPPATEADLLQKIRSEAVGPTDGVDHIDLRVHGDVVHLMGTSLDPEVEQELADKIAKVTGVGEVRNDLVPAR